MDPRQFVRNSNVEIRRPDTVISTQPQIQTQSASVFTDLRVGKLRPGIYNGVVNTLFTKDESRIYIKDILFAIDKYIRRRFNNFPFVK